MMIIDLIVRLATVGMTEMKSTFLYAEGFNSELEWDTSSVTNMAVIFYYATSFDQSVYAWNISKVSNFKMMFYMASSFSQHIGWEIADGVTLDEIKAKTEATLVA